MESVVFFPKKGWCGVDNLVDAVYNGANAVAQRSWLEEGKPGYVTLLVYNMKSARWIDDILNAAAEPPGVHCFFDEAPPTWLWSGLAARGATVGAVKTDHPEHLPKATRHLCINEVWDTDKGVSCLGRCDAGTTGSGRMCGMPAASWWYEENSGVNYAKWLPVCTKCLDWLNDPYVCRE